MILYVEAVVENTKYTLLQVKVLHSIHFTSVKVHKYWHQNTLKLPKVKALIMHTGPFQNIQHIISLDYNY